MAAVEALGTRPPKPTPQFGLASARFVKAQTQMRQGPLSVGGAGLVEPYGSLSVRGGGGRDRKSTLLLEGSSW